MKRTLEMNVKEAATKGTVLVCKSQQQVETLIAEGKRLGVNLPTPILMEDYHQRKLAEEAAEKQQ